MLSVLVWPFWTLPFWLLRDGAFGRRRRRTPRPRASSAGCCPRTPLLRADRARRCGCGRRSAPWRPEWPLDFPGVLPDRPTIALARDNARRNPQRTASTASALMIGLALVTLVAVLASGITSSFRGAVNDALEGRRLRDHGAEQLLADPDRAPQPPPRRTPGVTAVANVRGGDAQVFGKTIQATGVDPRRSADVQPRLGRRLDGRLRVTRRARRDRRQGLREEATTCGSARRSSSLSRTATRLPLEVRGIFDPPTGGSPFGRVTISDAAWDRFNDDPQNIYSFVRDAGRRDRRQPGRARPAARSRSRTRRCRRSSSSSTTRSPA